MRRTIAFLYYLATPILATCQVSQLNDLPIVNSGFATDPFSKKSYLGFEIMASVLPPAKITKEEGAYSLRSHLQSSYNIGINYKYRIKKNLFLSSGLHFTLGKRNLFADIPDDDINGWDGRKLIENKELWSSFRIPFLIEKISNYKKAGFFSFSAGLSFRYSGFMRDEIIETRVLYPNNQFYKVFHAELSGSNDRNPWITFLACIGRSFILDNKNIISMSILADISPTYFFNGNYEITIPNHPITKGSYKISGTSLGLSVQYTLTGTNRKLVRKYQEEKK